jgi:hypothetical protein
LTSSAFADDVAIPRKLAYRNAVNDFQFTRYPMNYNGGECKPIEPGHLAANADRASAMEQLHLSGRTHGP